MRIRIANRINRSLFGHEPVRDEIENQVVSTDRVVSDTPAPHELQAIRSAIAEGRVKSAARLLRKASRAWKRRPESWQWVCESAARKKVVPVALLMSKCGDYAFAAAILPEANHQEASVGLSRRIGRALVHGGQHESAVAVLKDVISSQAASAPEPNPEERRYRDAQNLGLAELYLAANNHVGNIASPTGEELKGFVLIYNVRNPVLTGLMVPLAAPLMEQGYGLAAVTAGTLRTPVTGIRAFDRLQECLAPDGTSWAGNSRQNLSHEWRIDWVEGVAEVDGINYFPYFQERLAQRARRYRADVLNDPESARRFADLLLQADAALGVCERLLALAARHKKPIRVAIMDSHFAPNGIIREWCDRIGHQHGIHAVVLSVGYENYFSNLSSLEATTLAVEDLTAQPELRQPFLGGPHRMNAALAQDADLDREPDEVLLSWIRQDRSKVVDTSEFRRQVLGRVREVRSDGGKVFVALGKVSVDFAAPGDRGFAHDDFVHWINHLVEAVSNNDNLLLIKPHPHELRQEIVGEGVQLLRELVLPDLPENVLFLEHDSFNTHELSDLVDAAFLWNGTAALEFSVLEVPVAPASIWAVRDYPVGLQILRSREEYEEVLQGQRGLQLAEGVTRRSAAFLRLMRSDHVAIPYRYVRRPATNLSVGVVSLDLDRLSRLEECPDPLVGRAASRFFEFFEP